jgi:hypothetical protein
MPTIEMLINLAEHGTYSCYYGQLLADALSETGRVAVYNGDGTISLYYAEMIRERNGTQSWAWRKETVRSVEQPIPDFVLKRFRPENR